MFSEVRILNELRVHFVEVRILKGLRVFGGWSVVPTKKRQREASATKAGERYVT